MGRWRLGRVLPVVVSATLWGLATTPAVAAPTSGVSTAYASIGAVGRAAARVAPSGTPALSAASSRVVTPPAAGIVDLVRPTRLEDTRAARTMRPGAEIAVCNTLPYLPEGVSGLFLNVTAVNPTASGYLTVWPYANDEPSTSSLNFARGETVANHVVVRLGAVDCVAIRNHSAGWTDVVVDVQGVVVKEPGTAPGTLTTLSYPVRFLDTRVRKVAVPANGYVDVAVTGRGGVPTSNVGSVALNLTVTGATASGYAVAAPAGLPRRPTATTVSFASGQTRAAMALTAVSSTGKVRLYNGSSRPIHVLADVFGYVRGGDATATPAGLVATAPQRIYDSRQSEGALAGGETRYVRLPDTGPVPAGSSGVVLSVTVTGTSRPGYLTVWGSTSFLNFSAGRNTTNSVLVGVSSQANAFVDVTNRSSGSVHAVIDVIGYIRPRVEVSGTVRTVAGEPVAGARVFGSAAGVDNPSVPAGAHTDANGRYRLMLGGMNASHANVQLCVLAPLVAGADDPTWAPTCHPKESPQPPTLTLPLGTRVTGADAALERGGTLRGEVTDHVGAPVTSDRLAARRVNDGRAFLIPVQDGRWELSRLPVGDYVLHIMEPKSATSTRFGLAREWLHHVPTAVMTPVVTQPIADVLAGTPKVFTVGAGDVTPADASLVPAGQLSVAAQSTSGTFEYDSVVELKDANGVTMRSSRLTGDRATRTFTIVPGSYTVCVVAPSGTRSCWDDPDDGAEGTSTIALGSEALAEVAITAP